MVVLAVSSLPFVPALAAAPDVVSYQGRLLNSNGVPVADASLEFVFRFFDAAAAGNCLWESDDGTACDGADETQTVALTDGLFSENIGSSVDPAGLSEAYPADLAGVFEGATEVWLEVVVDGETLTPRKQMVAAPYALDAQALDGMDSTDFLAAAGDTGTGVFDFTGATFAGGSPIVFEGATPDDFEATFAFTDPTVDRTITFQNADGTVAFLSDIAAGAGLWETGAFATYEDDDDVVIGTSGNHTIANPAFSLTGDDLFVAGNVGVEGAVVTDSSFVAGLSSFSETNLTFTGNGTIASGAGSQIFINVDGGNAPGENFLVTAANMSIGANGEITLTPNAAVGTAITLTDTDFTNALSIGDNNIVGTTAAIDFAEFDVSAATGSITIDDAGNAGNVSIEGTVIDINSFDFAGAGVITTTGAGNDLTLSPADLVSVSTDLAVGGVTAAAAAFGVDESTNNVYVGDGAGSNGIITFKASDADTGDMIFSSNDRWEFTGGDVFVGSSALGAVEAAFVPNGDDLYAAGDIAAQFNMYADAFIAGDASTTFGDGAISTEGATDLALTIAGGDLTFAQNTVIGDDGDTIFINSSDWDITDTGAMTGIASITADNNQAELPININVSGADAGLHRLDFQIDNNSALTISATGNGAGGVGSRTIAIGVSADADSISIGDLDADVGITDAQWNISTAGAASFTTLTMSGGLDMQSNAIVNIGNAGTDFTGTGGLTLAGAFTANGTAQFNSTSQFDSDVDLFLNGTENLRVTGTTGDAAVDLFALRLANTDTTAATQRGLYITNESNAAVTTTESLLAIDNLDADALTDAILVSATGNVTDAVDASAANITNALNVGDNTITGLAGVIDFTDFDVSADGLITVAPDGGGIAFTISPSAPMTAGIDFANTNVGVELQLQNDETISNTTDDNIGFSGAGGGDNTDLTIDLDGTRPVIFSNTDALVSFGDSIEIDPTAGDATISFFASDADTGSLSYTTSDAFSFTGGNFTHVGLDSLPSTLLGKSIGFSTSTTFTGASGANLDAIQLVGGSISVSNQATEGGGAPATVHNVFGVQAAATNSGVGAQAEQLIGLIGQAQNTSGAAAAIGDYAAGVEGFGLQNAAALTIPDLRGLSGRVAVNAGTATDLFAVRGEVEAGAGGATTSYGGYFDNNNEGLTRYGILASASGGGTANYAAYFHSAAVHIETNATPSSATLATGAGDLYVDGQLEVAGDSVTGGNIAAVTSGALTSGIGLVVQRTTSGTDFTNTTSGLVDFTITDAGSSGNILYLANSGTGSSLVANADADTGNTVSDSAGGAVHITNTGNSDYGLTVYTNDDTSDANTSLAYFLSDNAGFDSYVVEIRSNATTAGSANGTALHILQNQIDNPAADATGTQALIIDTNEDFGAAGGTLTDAMILVREDVGGTPDTVFRVDGDGDLWADGTLGAGASDVAEVYPSTDALVAGELVAIDPAGTGVLRSTTPYQSTIAGGVSTMPGVLLGHEEPGYRIALVGRIPLFVTDENGPIVPGDAITSSSTAGHGMKATEPGMIVGFALDAFAGPGSGSVSVFVSPQFYMGNVIATDGSVTQVEDDVELTGSLSVLGSGGGDVAQMTLVTDVTDATDYRLSIENADGTQVAYVSNEGDLALAGRFYPSDRGALQTSKYIYYDGSSGMGGDFMRTNASGWATGSYDFAEMFPSADVLEPGDVVVFGATDESVARSALASDPRLAGIVSTRPGFLAGENVEGHYPIALAGRVPTKVSDENGTIAIGDPLTSSSRPGYAMKATAAGAIVGYALEPYDGNGDDKIIAYVNVSYWNGGETPELPGTENVASTIVVTQNASNLTSLNMNGSVYMTGNDILGVRRLAGISERWSIEEDGTVRTPGTLRTITESYQGERVETAAVTSPDVQITLTGTGTLENGEAIVSFEDVSASFNDVTSTIAPIRVVVTPNGPVSLYVFEKDNDGFGVRQVNGRDNGVTFDWMVSAYRKGYEPVEEESAEETVEEPADETLETTVLEPVPVEDVATVDEPVVDDAVVVEPVVEPEPEAELGVESEPEPEPVVTEEPAPPASPEPIPDDSMESTVVEEPAP